MNVGRRHRLEIVTEILRNAKGGIQKTQLVYLTNINFTLLKKYQNLLVEKGLIARAARFYLFLEAASAPSHRS